MDILNNWYERISSFDKLKISEAQELYNYAINTDDSNKRKEIFKKIINGTLYVVLDHIKDNNLNIVSRTSEDINDIISSFIEEWIKTLYRGRLLEVEAYSYIFNSSFYNRFTKNILSYDYSVTENVGIYSTQVCYIFKDYLNYRNNNLDISYSDFLKILNRYGYYEIYNGCYLEAYDLFNQLYNHMNIDKLDDCNLSMTRFEDLKNLFFNNAIEDDLIESYYYTFEDKVLDNLYSEEFMKLIDESDLTNRQRLVLDLSGLVDGKYYSLEKLSKIMGITYRRVKQLRSSALLKVRRKLMDTDLVGGE